MILSFVPSSLFRGFLLFGAFLFPLPGVLWWGIHAVMVSFIWCPPITDRTVGWWCKFYCSLTEVSGSIILSAFTTIFFDIFRSKYFACRRPLSWLFVCYILWAEVVPGYSNGPATVPRKPTDDEIYGRLNRPSPSIAYLLQCSEFPANLPAIFGTYVCLGWNLVSLSRGVWFILVSWSLCLNATLRPRISLHKSISIPGD